MVKHRMQDAMQNPGLQIDKARDERGAEGDSIAMMWLKTMKGMGHVMGSRLTGVTRSNFLVFSPLFPSVPRLILLILPPFPSGEVSARKDPTTSLFIRAPK